MTDALDFICGRPVGAAWSLAEFGATFAMWLGMMGAMMTPTIVPWARALSSARQATRGFFLLGYLLVWSAFGLLATALQWTLSHFDILSAGRLAEYPLAAGVALAVVGLYQWTPLKQACLTHCESPARFFLSHWRDGTRGAMLMGAEHGLHCVGCCWLLMTLMLVAGAMSLPWMIGVGGFVLIEMYVSRLRWLSRAAGAVMVGVGVLFPILA